MKKLHLNKLLVTVLAFFAATIGAHAPAAAEILRFGAILSGDQEVPDPVDTDASGIGELLVDTVAQTVSFNLGIVGISIDELNDGLVANEDLGPIHLHNAPRGSNGPIVVPFAFSTDTYADTADGFSLSVTDFSYADAVAQSGSSVSFEDFVNGLISGNFYINLHTDLFGSGELRGQLSQVPLPGAISLFIFGAGALRLMRRKPV